MSYCKDIRECVRPKKINNDFVCRLEVNKQIFDWLQPYNNSETQSGITGTGFLLDIFNSHNHPYITLVTAYHVVEMGISIRVHVESLDEPRIANMICCNPDLDIALIRMDMSDVEKKELFHTSNGLEIGDSDKLRPLDNVQAIGFALAEPLQSTAGVISGRTNTAIQLDAAVNPGNSGGPVIDDEGKVVGIVVSGIDKAQNVNYAAPIIETLQSFQRSITRSTNGEKEPIFETCSSINAELCKSSTSLLRSCSNLCDGCYISYIHPNSCLGDAGICEGDFISHISTEKFESSVDRMGRIKLDIWPTPLSIDTLFSRFTAHSANHEQSIKLHVHKGDGSISEDKVIYLQTNLNKFRDIHPSFENVDFLLFAGIVFINLTYGQLRKNSRIRELTLSLMKSPENRSKSFVIVSHVHPESPLIQMSKIQVGSIITHINNTEIHSLNDMKSEIETKKSHTRLRLIDSSVCSCSLEDAIDSDKQVKKRLNWATEQEDKIDESKINPSQIKHIIGSLLKLA